MEKKQLSGDDRKLTSEQTYDQALAAMVTKLKEYIVPLVNEAFDERFTKNAKVEIKNSKHIIRQLDGSLSRRETDAYVKLSEMTETPVEKLYHFECETWYDKSIVVRIAEYGSVIASENALVTRDGIELVYPDSAVIFLRPSGNIPKQLEITHRAPNGSKMSYNVPTIQIKHYTVDDIFERRLLILLPFFLFKYADEFDEMEGDADRRRKVADALADIDARLKRLVESKEITVYQQRTTLRLLMRVSDRLTVGFENIRKGVDEIMSGYIARTDADDILDQGREEGREEGRKEGQQEMAKLMNFLLTNNRNEDAIKASSDRNYLDKLLAEFRSSLMAAK